MNRAKIDIIRRIEEAAKGCRTQFEDLSLDSKEQVEHTRLAYQGLLAAVNELDEIVAMNKRVEELELTICDIFEMNKIQRKPRQRWTVAEANRAREIMGIGRVFAARDFFNMTRERKAAQTDANKKCRVCACTEFSACSTDEGFCHWVEPDLCSACVGKGKG